ncbi:ribonuclease HII [Haploplasma axanthum]|nr:ribonuclease HII [Haploplasma axanthum]
MREYENDLIKKGITYIAGVDEAGRGPVAGPVVAAAVILRNDFHYGYINDSKKMSEKQREKAFTDIIENAIAFGVGIIDETIIDEINILEATKKAMTLAIENLKVKPEYVLIDAVKLNCNFKTLSIIKGDQKSISIAAASVIAKVTRDRLMKEYSILYPNYAFEKHKGYLTKIHKERIKEFGPCAIHRKTFAPIDSYYQK